MNGRRAFAWATLVVAVAGSAVAAWAYFRSPTSSAPRRLQGTLVAAVGFSSPTDAWVSTSGTKALYEVDGRWTLGTYGVDGVVSTMSVDEVSVLDDHRIYELRDPDVLVIDSTEYLEADGVLVGGDCYWCKVPFPAQPVLADMKDGRWKLTVGEKVVFVRQPDGWDGRPADAGLADEGGGVVIVARLDDGDTAIVDVGGTCTVEGTWGWVAAGPHGILLHRVDSARLTYDVERFPRCD